MSKLESLSRQIYAINFLIARPATLKEVMEHLAMKEELDDRSYVVSQRTFERDVKEINELFGFDIKFNRKFKKYQINNSYNDVAGRRILEAFDMLNALNHSNKVSDYILFEQRKPQGTEHLNTILACIGSRKLIGFGYQKFWDDEVSLRVVEPYAIREFKSRWYLVAKDLKDNVIKTFGLDRLQNPEQKSKSFTYPDADVLKNKFNHCFGVITPDKGKPDEIELLFSLLQAKYIKTLPLHHSQEIVKDDEDGLIVKLKLYNTIDLRMEILSYGKEVKVLKPKKLANEIEKMHREALNPDFLMHNSEINK